MKKSQEYLQISQAEEGRIDPNLTSLYQAAIQSANAEDNTSNHTSLATPDPTPVSRARKIVQQDNNNFASGFLTTFVLCAVHSTLVVRWSQFPSESEYVPFWAYTYLFDCSVSICAYIACLMLIGKKPKLESKLKPKLEPKLEEMSDLVGTSLSSLIVLAMMHLLLWWVFDEAFPGKQHASLWLLWKACASWSNVLMAVVMVTRNNGVEWAQSFYEFRAEVDTFGGERRTL